MEKSTKERSRKSSKRKGAAGGAPQTFQGRIYTMLRRVCRCLVVMVADAIRVLCLACEMTVGRWQWFRRAIAWGKQTAASRKFRAIMILAALVTFMATGGLDASWRLSYRIGRVAYRSTTWGGAAIEPLELLEEEFEEQRGSKKHSSKKESQPSYQMQGEGWAPTVSEEEQDDPCSSANLMVLGCSVVERPLWCAHVDYELMSGGTDGVNKYDDDRATADIGARRRLLDVHSWTDMATDMIKIHGPKKISVQSSRKPSRKKTDDPTLTNHRVAMCFVGDATALATDPLVHESILENLIGPTAGLSQVDSFFTIYNAPGSNSSVNYNDIPRRTPSLCEILSKFDPISVHFIRRPSCFGNSSATNDLQCCNPVKLRKASQGWYGTYGRPFDVEKHAAGLLEYYHIRQCFREVMMHEERASIRYDIILRVRPDLIVLRPPLISFRALGDLTTGTIFFDDIFVGGGKREPRKRGQLQDHFFAVPRLIARRFFERLFLQSLERFAAAPWATTKAHPVLLDSATGRSRGATFPSASVFDTTSSTGVSSSRRSLLGKSKSGFAWEEKPPHHQLDGRVPNCLTGPIRKNPAHGLTEMLREEAQRSDARRKRHETRRMKVYLGIKELHWGMFVPSARARNKNGKLYKWKDYYNVEEPSIIAKPRGEPLSSDLPAGGLPYRFERFAAFNFD